MSSAAASPAEPASADSASAGAGPAGPAPAAGPLIGLTVVQQTAAWESWNLPATVLPQSYVDHVTAADGVPLLLPAVGPEAAPAAAAKVVAALDGLILTGGPDVDAGRYGAERHPDADRPRLERDTWEAALLAAALAADLPVLAVGRGMQLLNVELGGTLYQHLPERAAFGDGHRIEPGRFSANRIDLDPAAPPGRFLGPQIIAWCHHHQGIATLGEGLQSTGNSVDGLIEAVWAPRRRWTVGVQWHPEEDGKAGLFKALTVAARAYRAETAARRG